MNFGHTKGHASESSGKFNDLLHGEAVGVGMLYFINPSLKERLLNVLEKYHLPINVDIDSSLLYKYISMDKKRSGNKITIVKVQEIGTYELIKINLEEIKNYL